MGIGIQLTPENQLPIDQDHQLHGIIEPPSTSVNIVPYHEYESIDEDALCNRDHEIAVTDEMHITEKNTNASPLDEAIMSHNPAYNAVEREDENTGYQNVITPWSYYHEYL